MDDANTADQFSFEGRWEDHSKPARFHYIADLPCSGVSFNVDFEQADSTVTLKWHGLRSRIQVTIQEMSGDRTTAVEEVLVGKAVQVVPWSKPEEYVIDFSKYSFKTS